ncbi:MAG TPA: Si-specific NAD(P)(+) transhydrogenase [Planctomycetes bacterium]|nr:Si-specific NAD(P)(+) transhydrogenase [Planctomycetota bacterium]
MSETRKVDVLVIGGGPAGMKGAIQAAKEGRDVLLVEREPALGGECVNRGTIPSKTLRETAVYLANLRQRSAGLFDAELRSDIKVASLMKRLTTVVDHLREYLGNQVARNGIRRLQGMARFVSPEEVELVSPTGEKITISADIIMVATGTRPRTPPEVPVDHEHILDSDSILSLIYLPTSMTVLGAGVIACEYATLFAALGVEVLMVEKRDRPLGFLDRELTDHFVESFERAGGRFIPNASVESVHWDGVSRVITKLADGEILRTEKMLCALGRVASVRTLAPEKAGVEMTDRGLIRVDETFTTTNPRVIAVGDVIGPPALATTAMFQGRKAMRHALGLPAENCSECAPIGIYTVPEIGCVGMREEDAIEAHGGCIVGHAPFQELARAHISGNTEGFLKLVCDPAGRKILGVHAVGEGATDLVHIAQIAIAAGLEVDAFLENVFNFPTLAEAYCVAAIDVIGQRTRLEEAASAAA